MLAKDYANDEMNQMNPKMQKKLNRNQYIETTGVYIRQKK